MANNNNNNNNNNSNSMSSFSNRGSCSRRSVKRVRFSCSPPVVHTSSAHRDSEQHEHHEVWWQSHDYESFRENIQQAIESAMQDATTTMRLTNNMYNSALQIASITNDKTLPRVLEKLSMKDYREALHWSNHELQLRGLERQVLFLQLDENTAHNDITSTLQQQQTAQQRRQHVSFHAAVVLWEQHKVSNHDELRMISQYMSRTSRVLARLLAQGDEIAVAQVPSSSSSSSSSSLTPPLQCTVVPARCYKNPIAPAMGAKSLQVQHRNRELHRRQVTSKQA